MDKDFAFTTEKLNEIKDEPFMVFDHKRRIKDLQKVDLQGNVLDIGERNPLTERMEEAFGIMIDSTAGDLDVWLFYPKKKYDIIIFSHVIEHLFNPLLCLENIKKVMKPDALLFIATPIHPHFLTPRTGHFHEMDEYRFRKLIQRAGLKIIRWEKTYFHRHIHWTSFTGIRPFLRMFYKCHSWVTLIKSE